MYLNSIHSFSFSYLSFSLKDPRYGLVNRIGGLSICAKTPESLPIQAFVYLMVWLLFSTGTLYSISTSCPSKFRNRSSTSIWIYRISTNVTFA